MDKKELYEKLFKVQDLIINRNSGDGQTSNLFEAVELLEDLINKTQFINEIK